MKRCGRLDVVVPICNEGEIVIEAVERIREIFVDSNYEVKIYIVVDGPDESTRIAAASLEAIDVEVILLSENFGKGVALREGLSRCKAEYVGFVDGDLDIDPSSLLNGVEILQCSPSSRLGFVYGSKHHMNSRLSYPLLRRLQSSVYRLFLKILFGLAIEDTQTGLKVFRNSAISPVLQKVQERGFLFDVELLTLLVRDGWNGESIPVSIDFRFSSTIRTVDVLRIGIETLNLRKRLGTSEQI